MPIRDLSAVLKNAPAGEWVALSRDKKKILGHSRTAHKAIEAAKKAGENEPFLVRMPDKNVGIAAGL